MSSTFLVHRCGFVDGRGPFRCPEIREKNLKLNKLVGFIFKKSNFGPPKFNRKSDGPQNGVKTTAMDIGEFTMTIKVSYISNFVSNSVKVLGGPHF
jgi:hypothetical protein